LPTCVAADTKDRECSGPTDAATSAGSAIFNCRDSTAGEKCSCQKTATGTFQWFCRADTIVCADTCCSNLKETKEETATTADISTRLCEDAKIEVDSESAESFDGVKYRVRLAIKYTLTEGSEIPEGLISDLADILFSYDITVTISTATVDGKKQLTVLLFISDEVIEKLGTDDFDELKAFFTDILSETTESRLDLDSEPEISQYVVEDAIIDTNSNGSPVTAVVTVSAIAIALF